MKIRIIILLPIPALNGFPQTLTVLVDDPCGYDPEWAALTLRMPGTG